MVQNSQEARAKPLTCTMEGPAKGKQQAATH